MARLTPGGDTSTPFTKAFQTHGFHDACDLLVIDRRKVRGSLKGVIFHSDHGSVYTSQAFRDHCAQLGVRQSMGAVGTSADNALAESFNATLKREVLRDRKVFDNPITCRQEVFRWCMRYNTRRRHSWCNLLAPDTFEAFTSATLAQAA